MLYSYDNCEIRRMQQLQNLLLYHHYNLFERYKRTTIESNIYLLQIDIERKFAVIKM